MTIYGEYLFLENFATGIIILFFTGKILGVKPAPFRYLLCGCCCGAYAFVLFLPLSGILSWIGKIIFSLLMTRIAFAPKESVVLLQGAAVFLGITMLYGGIAIAVLTSFSRTGVTAAAGVYLAPLTYISVTAAATAAALFLWLLLNILKARRMAERRVTEAELILGNCTWKLQGLIDSGNELKEPLTGRPVSIVDRYLGEQFLQQAGASVDAPARYTIIPYHTVGVEQGVMEGFRLDAMRFPDGFTIKNPVIALCEEGHFRGKEGERYRESKVSPQILLPASLLERGIYGDN